MRHEEQETGLLARVKIVEAIRKELARVRTAAQRFFCMKRGGQIEMERKNFGAALVFIGYSAFDCSTYSVLFFAMVYYNCWFIYSNLFFVFLLHFQDI